MAWTAPRTWSTSEVVTASMMNTHVRDNLNYLKGNAGAVLISDTLQATKLGVGVAPSASYIGYFNGGTLPLRVEQSTSAINGIELRNSSQDSTNKWALRIRSVAEGDFSLYDMTAGVDRFYINSTGRVGINRTAPTGMLHMYDTISGAIKFEADAVAGTAVTVVANGAGDVLYRLMAMFVIRASDGTTAVGNATSTVLIPGGGDQVLHTSGSDSLALRVNADGSVDVRRSAGSTLTFKIALWAIWL